MHLCFDLYDDATGYFFDVTVEVTHFEVIAPADADSYGYTELDYDILECVRYDENSEDRNAPLPSALSDDLEEQVLETMQDLEHKEL